LDITVQSMPTYNSHGHDRLLIDLHQIIIQTDPITTKVTV